MKPLRCCFALGLALLAVLGPLLRGYSGFTAPAMLADFGYNIHRVNGEPATNTRPLLIILATNRAGLSIPPGRDANYFRNLLFNLSATQSVMGFFRENSSGRFRWTEAGIVGPVVLSTNESLSVLGDDRYYSNIIARVVTSRLFDFKSRDSNNDGTVTPDELQLVFIMNEDRTSGGARGTSLVKSNVPNGNVDISAPWNTLLFINYETAFDSIAHELTHTLGAGEDLYIQGDANISLNHKVTLMSNTSRDPDKNDTRHLDPWNKMRLGWSEPRIMLLNTGGVVTLPAAHLQITNAPVILYDTNYGPRRFFFIEYRMQTNYDRNVLSNGMVLWHVIQDQNNDALHIPSAGARFDSEGGWLPCLKCACFVDTKTVTNRCAADGFMHAPNGGPYFLERAGAALPGQQEWRRCRKCQGLYFSLSESTSICPLDGLTHLQPFLNNQNYSLRTNGVRGALGDWYRCFKCQSFFHQATQTNSTFFAAQTCPAGDNHNATNSIGTLGQQYYLVAWDWAMFSMFPPNFSREPGTRLWEGGEVTPVLSWVDGISTKSYLYIRPYSPGATEITVEVRSAEDTWVDFNFASLPRNGSFSRPYNTLAEGVDNAAWGGLVHFKPGSSAETAIISKPLTFDAPLGTVTIGQ
jgi:M6 family metalloprotease-like protein